MIGKDGCYFQLLLTICLLNVAAGDVQLVCGQEASSSQGVLIGRDINRSPVDATDVRTFDHLTEYAQARSAAPFVACPSLPPALENMTYDQFRYIHYRHDHGVWWNSEKPFCFEGFHRGFVHRNKVSIYTVNANGVEEFVFDPRHFEYRDDKAQLDVPADTGYAGFKLAGRFPGTDDVQETITFLGASYFRARTAETVYGASNRGLAINVGTNGPEEFPVFREFWIQEPQRFNKHVVVLALLDSESVTGAYEFSFQPETDVTEMRVRASLFFRTIPEKVALAPLTSMWMWGDGLEPPPLDNRPSVHDSDGLLVHADGRWTWRALNRISYPSVSRIPGENLEGFGLLQRETNFERYRDTGAQYHKRPSLWITPGNEWPRGQLELLELPAAHEGIDNIGAYWVVDPAALQERRLEFSYKISWFSGNWEHREQDFLGKVVQTRVDRSQAEAGLVTLEIDFQGPALKDMPGASGVQAQVNTIRAEVQSQTLKRKKDGCLTLTITLRPTEDAPFEVRAELTDSGRMLTETFCYLCPLESPPYQFPQVYTRRD